MALGLQLKNKIARFALYYGKTTLRYSRCVRNARQRRPAEIQSLKEGITTDSIKQQSGLTVFFLSQLP